jgi:hypothetical protein
MRNGIPFVVRGCPFKQVPHSVNLFLEDMEKQVAGHMAPYRHDEMPAKFQDMLELYKVWRPFFEIRRRQRDEAPSGLSEIEAFRQKEGKR